MKDQIIITIGREFGSGGHEIGERLAASFDIPLYDKEKIESLVAEDSGYDLELVRRMDEKPVSRLFSRRLDEHSTSIPEHVARKTFELIQKLADSGQSFVVVGRCAEHVLRNNPSTVSFFINGETEWKIKRLMETQGFERQEAISKMKLQNAMRKSYHNFHCEIKWGDSRGYDMVVNASTLGIEKTVDVMSVFIREFRERQ